MAATLPLYLLINLVPAWLRSEHIDLRVIGLFTLMQLPYTWKFLWSPLLDRYAFPALGRRRGWMLVTQLALLDRVGDDLARERGETLPDDHDDARGRGPAVVLRGVEGLVDEVRQVRGAQSARGDG